MAADLALVSVLVQLLVDLVASDNIDFYNLMPAVEGECVYSSQTFNFYITIWDQYFFFILFFLFFNEMNTFIQ